VSPPSRGRTTESTSPHRGRRRRSKDRGKSPHTMGDSPLQRKDFNNERPSARPKSLSPFSKRLALTQSMNMGR
jgi:hypothetical protein